MRFFFKTVAANLLAILITLFVLAMVGVVGVVIFVKVAAGTARHETAVHDKSVLVFDMDVAITDAPEHSDPSDILSLSNLASGGGSTSRLTVFEIVNAIDAAAKDNKIVALYLSGSLDTDNAASGYAALREVRQALERFKASGKKIYAYLDEPTVKDYYLASVANEISLNPFGTLSINGLAAESFYLRDALQKYGVGVQVTRVGKYKSYVEMFTEDHMSDADREQLTQLLGGIWNFVSSDMAASRKLDEPTFKQLANGPGVFIAQDALKDKLVDKLAYLDEIIDKLEDVGSYDEDNDTFYQVALSSYAGRLEWLSAYKVSALFAAGGTGEFFSLTLDEVARVVKAAAEQTNGRVPVVAGAGYGTENAKFFVHAAEASGADGILLLPPYLLNSEQSGLAAHIEAVCSSTSLGVIVYNRDNAILNENTLEKLCDRCPNLVGFKDGVGDIELMTRIYARMGDRLTYVGGLPTAEMFALPYLEMGVTTYSSAIFNFLPVFAQDFYAAVRRRDHAEVFKQLRDFVIPYINIRNASKGYAVSIVKAGMKVVGRSAGPVRTPLTDLDASEMEALTKLIGNRT